MATSRFHSYRPSCVLAIAGLDAATYLQGQFSNDLAKAWPGGRSYGLWLDRKGKALADSFVLGRGSESFLAVSYYCDEAVVRRRLEDYLVMDEVELEGLADSFRGWSLFGAAQESVSSILGLPLPPASGFSEMDGVFAFWGRRGSDSSLEILVDERSSFATDAAERIEKGLLEQGAVPLAEEDLALLAIRGATPRIGKGFGATDLPQDLGLVDTAVSFTKGCYLGQEVMARLRSLGRVRKRLARIRIPNTSGSLGLPADLLDEAGKRQGELRELAYSDGGAIGLAVVSTSFAGSELRTGELRVELEEGSEGLE